MEQKKFMTYKNTHPKIACRECGRTLNIENFYYCLIHNDNTGICRSCSWIKNHTDKMNYKDYDEKILRNIIRYVFESNSKDCILNDLASMLNIQLTELIEIMQHLKIGNRPYKVKVNCEFCNKEVIVSPCKVKSNNFIYCSHDCYRKDKTNKVPKGKDNSQYKRIRTYCTNCGKPIEKIPSSYNTKNRFNDNHNFCCQACYWEYRSKYYTEDKSNGKHVIWTKELKEKMIANKISRMKFEDRLNTTPQIKVNNILDKLGIKYIREYGCTYYSIDNYLSDYNLMIEVMGDYWHANPNRFNKNKYLLTSKQFEGIHRDKLKKSYIYNHFGINILYLWEYDILKREQLCTDLILKYISSSGILDNYHSFNYEIIDNIIQLKESLVIPYQDQPVSKYKSLLKKIS